MHPTNFKTGVRGCPLRWGVWGAGPPRKAGLARSANNRSPAPYLFKLRLVNPCVQTASPGMPSLARTPPPVRRSALTPLDPGSENAERQAPPAAKPSALCRDTILTPKGFINQCTKLVVENQMAELAGILDGCPKFTEQSYETICSMLCSVPSGQDDGRSPLPDVCAVLTSLVAVCRPAPLVPPYGAPVPRSQSGLLHRSATRGPRRTRCWKRCCCGSPSSLPQG